MPSHRLIHPKGCHASYGPLTRPTWRACVLTIVAAWLASAPVAADEPAGDGAFFEKRIQPLLERHCYECHSAKADEVKGNLRVDSYEALLKGGNNGRAVIPGDTNSFLLRVIRYEEDDYKMPPRARLPDDEIKDVERWIKEGARGPKPPRKRSTGSESAR